MMTTSLKNRKLVSVFFVIILLSTFYFLISAIPAFAQTNFNLKPDCNPSLPPNATPQQIQEAINRDYKNANVVPTYAATPCDVSAAVEFLKKIINFMLIGIVPLASLFIIWGGFVMLTSGGSGTKFEQGKKIITAAVIGLAIAFGSYLIVNTILAFIKTGQVL